MLIKLRVHPDSKHNEIRRKKSDHYEVWVKAPAEDNRANKACLVMLGHELGVPARTIRIMKGAKSPSKIVEVP